MANRIKKAVIKNRKFKDHPKDVKFLTAPRNLKEKLERKGFYSIQYDSSFECYIYRYSDELFDLLTELCPAYFVI